MDTKSELILDIGGVLATNFSPSFWQDLSAKSGASYDNLDKFKKKIREELWNGWIAEEEFWNRLSEQFPSIDIEKAQLILHSYIKPLPAIKMVPVWSQYANIHLLSNHRIEWIEPILNLIEGHIKSITVSSQVGSCKPQAEIYSKVNSLLNKGENILFIDDQEKNFKQAKMLRWDTLLADANGDWIVKVIPLLKRAL
jgi:FMN phosphatase YigB (HAD superfamily)